MKLKQLDALRAVSEAGSLQGAAVKLNVTQPAISRSIIELESELGIALLTRTARGTTLTEIGSSILARAQVIDREVRRIKADVDATRGAFNGRFVIAITPPAATAALANTITEFSDARPDVQLHVLELRPKQITDGLRDGSLDVAIFTHYGVLESSPHYELEPLYELGTTLAVSGRYQGALDLNVEHLQEVRWLVIDAMTDKGSFFSHLFALHRLQPPSRILRCSSVPMYIELARRLDVVSMWTDAGLAVLEKRVADGTMRRLNLREGTPGGRLCIAYPNADLMTSTARDFVGWLRYSVRNTGTIDHFTLGAG